MRCNSWIITDRETGKAILETWNWATAEHALSLGRYRIETAHEYLCRINAAIAKAKGQ